MIPKTEITPVFIDIKKLEKQMGVSRNTLWKAVIEGQLPAPYKLGRKVLFKTEEVNRYMNSLRHSAIPKHIQPSSQ